MTVVAAELADASLAPADLSLCLLPFFVPHVYQWRRATLGIRDTTAEMNMGC